MPVALRLLGMEAESHIDAIRDDAASYAVEPGNITPPIKYTRGENPRSLANLKAFEPGHPAYGNARSGPLVTPALRKLAEMPRGDVEALLEAGTLNSAEEIAARLILAVLDGSDRGSKARDQLMNRLDGEPEKSTPAIAVQVNLTWNDGESA